MTRAQGGKKASRGDLLHSGRRCRCFFAFATLQIFGFVLYYKASFTLEKGAHSAILQMKCPNCGFQDSKVIDSRPIEEGNSIRRRRECLACQKRFTTFEVIESMQILVVKKNGTKELSGIMKVCQKRPVNGEEIAAEIEAELQNSLVQEVTSRRLGEMIMYKLKARDDVAYVRFASVYREFKDLDTFLAELKELKEQK